MSAPTLFQLQFEAPASLEAVRAFCAEAVRLARAGEQGDWVLTKSTPRPHEGHGTNAALAHTTWQLGTATLQQNVDGGDGNPRDGYGFDLSVRCDWVGDDGVARIIRLSNSSYDPFPSSLLFELIGFTSVQFTSLRASGAERFGRDNTSHVVWAKTNLEGFVRCGDREGARALAREALKRKDPAFTTSSRRQIQRQLCELTDDPAAREVEESAALLGDPTDLERLTRVASGELVLPGWTREVAAAVLLKMRPWTDPASPAHTHPWSGAPQASFAGWLQAQWQPHVVKELNGRRQPVPEGTPKPLSHLDTVNGLLLSLGIHEQFQLGSVTPEVDEEREGVILSREPSVNVRGMVFRRVRRETEHLAWSWLFTGASLDGAIVVSRLAAPFDLREPSLETHVLFVGDVEKRRQSFIERGRHLLTPVQP